LALYEYVRNTPTTGSYANPREYLLDNLIGAVRALHRHKLAIRQALRRDYDLMTD
jgi:hypothetical protein